jgi:hypothetical protein
MRAAHRRITVRPGQATNARCNRAEPLVGFDVRGTGIVLADREYHERTAALASAGIRRR